MIILMGVAGSGKSTQGRLLADQKGYAWISTGEILRVLITGSRRQEMLKGKLLSDQEMTNVMDKVLDIIDLKDEFVLDGFPRTIVQARWLLDQVDQHRFSRIVVLHLFSDRQVVHDRLKQRGRADDSEKAIAERFKEYESVTLPILEELKQHGIKIYDIDASQKPEAIHRKIMQYLANLPVNWPPNGNSA